MKVFLNRSSPVSIQEQLAAQIGQTVAAGDLEMGALLPSIRVFAARLQVHHNTVRILLDRRYRECVGTPPGLEVLVPGG